jgi:hypothetical protein
MLSLVKRIVPFAAAALLAACGGGASSVTPPSSGVPLQPSGQSVAVQFTIVLPPRSGTAASRRGPRYVSASTKSATVTVTPSGGTASPATVISCSATTCSGKVQAPVGTDTFTATLFSQTGGTGSPLATGSVTHAIVLDQANVVSVAFDGIVASLSLSLLPATVTQGTSQTVAVTFAALDAGGNTIVGPYVDENGNAIAVTLSDSDTTGATKLSVTQLTGSPAAPVTLAYNGAAIASPTITVSAAAIAPASKSLTVGTGGPMTAAQIAAAFQTVQAYYATLPHANVYDDLQALAAHMTSSGAFKTAAVADGGIDATFPNGSQTVIFADRIEDLTVSSTASASRSQRTATRAPLDAPLSPATHHEIAYLINESGDVAFRPQRQQDFRAAWIAKGFTSAAGYGVDTLDVTLENITALGGSAHPLDYLNIATHGMVDVNGRYFLQSTTNVTDAALKTYAQEVAAHTIIPGFALHLYDPVFVFSTEYIQDHLRFNPGAIVVNESCYGQSQQILSGPSKLQANGVGQYYGWTQPVEGADADETDAFMLDRLLGEQSPSVTHLDKYAYQRTPPQRAFSLDAVFTAMQTEDRASPIHSSFQPGQYTYVISPANPRYYDRNHPPKDAYMIVSDYGGEQLADAPVEYALPSIEYLDVNDTDSSGAILQIVGSFSGRPGTVTIANPFGTATLTPSSWGTSEIGVPVPGAGAGAWGKVSVIAGGIASDPVPLTQWDGQISYTTNARLTQWQNTPGSGSYTLNAKLNVAFRADVHQTVATIDTTPKVQNFAFSGLEAGTSGTISSFNGSFTSSQPSCSGSDCTVTLSLAPGAPVMQSGPQGTNAFDISPGAVSSAAAASCNNGGAGPQSGTHPDVFCTILGYDEDPALGCTSNNGSWCVWGTGLGGGGYVTLTMDPSTYAVSVGSPAAFPEPPWINGAGTVTVNITGTIQPPLSAPAAQRVGANTGSRSRP